MLESLQHWNPAIPINIPALKKATGSIGKFQWTSEMEEEYQAVLKAELKNLGIRGMHSSAYNSLSMGLVERSVRMLKDILNKIKL